MNPDSFTETAFDISPLLGWISFQYGVEREEIFECQDKWNVESQAGKASTEDTGRDGFRHGVYTIPALVYIETYHFT
jgi:hypothetical protein